MCTRLFDIFRFVGNLGAVHRVASPQQTGAYTFYMRYINYLVVATFFVQLATQHRLIAEVSTVPDL